MGIVKHFNTNNVAILVYQGKRLDKIILDIAICCI